MQSHPFVVISWNVEISNELYLELLIKPRTEWTRTLHRSAINGNLRNSIALFSGPHGIPVEVEKYEYIFMIAKDYGIAAFLPLLKRLVSLIGGKCRVVRICVVWELCELDTKENADIVAPSINSILDQDKGLCWYQPGV